MEITLISVSSAIDFMWMVHDPTGDKAALVQERAWCRQPSADRQQAISWNNFDYGRWSHMGSLGHNE